MQLNWCDSLWKWFRSRPAKSIPNALVFDVTGSIDWIKLGGASDKTTCPHQEKFLRPDRNEGGFDDLYSSKKCLSRKEARKPLVSPPQTAVIGHVTLGCAHAWFQLSVEQHTVKKRVLLKRNAKRSTRESGSDKKYKLREYEEWQEKQRTSTHVAEPRWPQGRVKNESL